MFKNRIMASSGNVTKKIRVERLQRTPVDDVVEIDLSDNELQNNSEEIALLLRFRDLKILKLSSNKLTDESISILLQLEQLEFLNISFNNFTESGVSKLLKMPYLKRLIIEDLVLSENIKNKFLDKPIEILCADSDFNAITSFSVKS